jgi:hypothetical protein
MMLVLIDFLRRDFTGNDLAKNAVSHEADANRAMRSRAIVWLGDSLPRTN